MNQQDYFKVRYKTDKKKLKRQFIDEVVAESEKDDVNPIELRMKVRALKAQYKHDKKALKK